jgi:hypothetical protein
MTSVHSSCDLYQTWNVIEKFCGLPTSARLPRMNLHQNSHPALPRPPFSFSLPPEHRKDGPPVVHQGSNRSLFHVYRNLCVGELRNLKHHLFQILFAHLFTVFQLPSQDTILNDRNWFISAEENIYPGKNGIVPFILPFTVPQRVVACDIPSNSHIIFVPERVSHGVDSTIETAGKKVFARIGPPFCFLPLEYSASSEFLDTVGASHLVAIAASLATFVELDNFGYFTNVGLVKPTFG